MERRKGLPPPSLSDPRRILCVADAPVGFWVSRRRCQFSVVSDPVAHRWMSQHTMAKEEGGFSKAKGECNNYL